MNYWENNNQSNGFYGSNTRQSQTRGLSTGQQVIARSLQSSKDFLLDRMENGETPAIRAEAQAALERLSQVNVEDYQPVDDIEAHQIAMSISRDTLGDQSRFFTNTELSSMRQDYEADVANAIERGDLYDDGRIPSMYVSGFSPAGENGIVPYGGRTSTGMFFGMPLDDYMKKRFSDVGIPALQQKYEHVIYKNDKENPVVRKHVRSQWDEPVVVSEFTGRPNYYDAEYNKKRNANADERYAGPQHYALVAHTTKKGGAQRLDLLNLDMPSQFAHDYNHRYYYPFTGYSTKDDDGTMQSVNRFLKAEKKYSPYDPVDNGEILQREQDRIRHLNKADENGVYGNITPGNLKLMMSIANSDEESRRNGEIDYGGIQYIDPYNAQIRTKGYFQLGSRAADLRAQKAAEREQAAVKFARGGHLRTPKTIRSSNGIKMHRAEGLGGADYDIYF